MLPRWNHSSEIGRRIIVNKKEMGSLPFTTGVTREQGGQEGRGGVMVFMTPTNASPYYDSPGWVIGSWFLVDHWDLLVLLILMIFLVFLILLILGYPILLVLLVLYVLLVIFVFLVFLVLLVLHVLRFLFFLLVLLVLLVLVFLLVFLVLLVLLALLKFPAFC